MNIQDFANVVCSPDPIYAPKGDPAKLAGNKKFRKSSNNSTVDEVLINAGFEFTQELANVRSYTFKDGTREFLLALPSVKNSLIS